MPWLALWVCGVEISKKVRVREVPQTRGTSHQLFPASERMAQTRLRLRPVDKKFVLWVGSAVAMTLVSLFFQSTRLVNSSIRNTEPRKQNFNNGKTLAFVQESMTGQERSYNSSLRYDWTNLPPMTPLGKILELSSTKCMSKSFVKQHGPQELVYFEMIPSGMGSSLHTWMNPLCHAAATGKVLITGGTDKFKQPWLWNDEASCRPEFEKQKNASMAYELQRKGFSSSLDCYFGWHASSWRCPPGTLAWNKTIVNHNSVWQRYQCHEYQQQYGRSGVLSAVAEWLFQNVSRLVVDEAERQIREEAFPVASLPHSGKERTNQRWPELPRPEDLITVHIRWGDKAREMDLVTVAEFINASKSILTEDELVGAKPVHFCEYLRLCVSASYSSYTDAQIETIQMLPQRTREQLQHSSPAPRTTGLSIHQVQRSQLRMKETLEMSE